jgi:eukaryotic-like serine/threonine-protein kinase
VSVDRRRVDEICDAALQRSPEQREAYLDSACGADVELRREVDSLLKHAQAASSFLSAPVAQVAAAVLDSSASRIGTRIGQYEIRSRLGRGGMGEVYCARDTKLDRDVAIKMLPPDVAADADRLSRFQREARLLASLSHANIGAIYGVEDTPDGARALVLELIEGETLAALIARGPLTLERALTIGRQIADALDHAHRKGITHRDLKPSNVMVSKAGIKVLDFGLAKWSRRDRAAAASEQAVPTMAASSSLTAEGAILGTLHYMAPEQLEGQDADARSDVFALGAVLYEMFTGRQAFAGASQASVIAAILTSTPPPPSTLQAGVPPRIDRIVAKCLEKDRDARWQSARDLADELRWALDDLTGSTVGADRVSPTGLRRQSIARWGAAVAGAAAIITSIGWAAALLRRPAGERPVVRLTLLPPANASFALAVGGLSSDSFDVAPDGSHLVYVGVDNGRRRLFVWRFDQFEPIALPGTEDALSPFFAPDSRWVAFVVREGDNERIKKIDTGAPSAPVVLGIVDRTVDSGAAWLDKDSFVFGVVGKGLYRLPAEGGEPKALTTVDEKAGEQDHHVAQLLPGGQLLMDVHLQNGAHRIAVENMRTHERRVVIPDGFDAHYLPSGHIVFARGEQILAVPFDLGRLASTGTAVMLVDHVATFPRNGAGAYRLSANGTLVFQPARSTDQRTLVWVSGSGVETPVPIPAQSFTSPRISPDGKRVAFALEGGQADIGDRRDLWVYELAGGKMTRLTDIGANTAPVWTPDSARLVYSQRRDGRFHLVWQKADAIGAAETLASDSVMLIPASWTADQRTLVYVRRIETGSSHIFGLRVDGDRKPVLLLPDARSPRLSPDGRWLAFTSATGRTQAAVTSFPALGSRQQISTEGGREPVWSADGRRLFYRNLNSVYAATVTTAGGLSIGRPEVLFTGPYMINGTFGLDYDIAPDGRVLMVKRGADELAPATLRAVVNWGDELARRVPAGRQ